MANFDEVFDWVVVGSGGGSMCSALVMRDQGKSVVILEKTEYVGGTTARSGGVLWIPNNPLMQAEGIEDSYEKAVTYLDAFNEQNKDAPGATRERRYKYLREAPQMIRFLQKHGVPFQRVNYWPDYYDDLPGGSKPGRTVVAELFDLNRLGAWKKKMRPGFLMHPATLDEALLVPRAGYMSEGRRVVFKVAMRIAAALLTRKQWVSAGMALQAWMLQASLREGVDIRTETPVSEIIIEDGAVKGVLTVKNGKPWRIGARLGVLINAGGFAKNQRMRDQYIPGTSTEWSGTAEGDTGEMIEEMMRKGAAVAQMNERVGNQNTLSPGSENDFVRPGAQMMGASPHAILVDQSGVRYMNEGGSYMAYCKAMLERHQVVSAIPSWMVFDSQFSDRYLVAGKKLNRKRAQSWREAGYLKYGDTIEALAQDMNVDPKTLAATVSRFNGFVANNCDEDFHRGDRAYDHWLGDPTHKPSGTLGTIERGPFYAIPIHPGDVGTYGGVVTDEFARVLREDGSVIEGLYATGVSTASVMGRAYPGAGSSVGPSFTWGFIAAKHAAGVQEI
ncbi:MAG TPA: FAD-dependent oxidoreductase [Spongiibacteraceae bacterium]|nr:FAD-dependent oxidoreductase [Spongiibacteraceae bacterium]